MAEDLAKTHEFEYDVFLCHNGADKDWTEELGSQIEAETIDGSKESRNLKVFFDKWDIDIGENFIARINEGLRKSRFVACILSPEFMSAPWPTFEWTHIVADDPINAKKRLIPILARKKSLDGSGVIDMCAPFKALNYVDMSDSEKHKANFPRLIRRIRGLKPARGGVRKAVVGDASPVTEGDESEDGSSPDQVTDVLLCNLLKVISWPLHLFSAPTDARFPSDIYSKIEDCEPFILRDKRVYTFADLRKSDVRLLGAITGEVKVESRNEWLLDDDRAKQIMYLLSRCLSGHLSKLAIKLDKKRRYFFRPKDGATREWKNKNDPSREVAAQKTNQSGDVFWVHHAARIRFRRLVQNFFLLIEPTYIFTKDGNEPMDGDTAGKLFRQWGGKQQNDSALRNLVFWAKAIARSAPTIRVETGGEPIVIETMPSITQLSYGIELDHIKIGSLLSKPDMDLELAAEDVLYSADSQEEDDDEEDDEPKEQ